jgi:hypothetical protein
VAELKHRRQGLFSSNHNRKLEGVYEKIPRAVELCGRVKHDFISFDAVNHLF